jgi:hypothetical protein
MPVDFPQSQVIALHNLATQLIDKRKPNTELTSLARDLLNGFFDVCSRWGLDRVLSEVGELEDREAPLVKQLQAINVDGGSPRNQKAKQLADCVLAALDLTPVEEPDRRLFLPDTVRAEVVAALGQVIEPELPKLRDSIIAEGSRHVEDQASYTKTVAQLDDRGQKILKLPKIPLESQHAIEKALAAARQTVLARIINTAFDRVKVVLERADPEAAKRIDAPITLEASPRQVAVIRANSPLVPKTAQAITGSLLESLAELAKIAFRAAEKPVHPYSASKTFAVGDVVEHPKFGRGTVVAISGQRMDVEFEGVKNTLVHGR